MPAVSFVAAASGSGKTTLIEKVVRIATGRGLRVAVIKHASKGFDLDVRGKDSWRFEQAGADAVLLVGPDRLALLKKLNAEPSPEDLAGMVSDADLVILEGFKRNAKNKIEVFRAGVSGERPLCLDDPSFIALASDTPFAVSIPRFDLDDAEGVAAFILQRIFPLP